MSEPLDDAAATDDDLDEEDFEGDEDDDFEDDEDEDFEDEIGAAGNRVVGATPKAVLEYVARNIVDEPDEVFVEVEEKGDHVTFRLHVAPDDLGKVIGRRGRVAQAIRQVVRAAGANEDVRTTVDIVD